MKSTRIAVLVVLALLVGLPSLAQTPSEPAPPAPAPGTPQPTPPAAEPAPPAAQPAPPPAAQPPQTPAMEKASIIVDGKAKSDGYIELYVGATPETTKAVRITVASGMKAPDIARDIEKEVKVALGSTYDVSGGAEKVTLKAPKKQTFRISIGSVTPLGVAVKVK